MNDETNGLSLLLTGGLIGFMTGMFVQKSKVRLDNYANEIFELELKLDEIERSGLDPIQGGENE